MSKKKYSILIFGGSGILGSTFAEFLKGNNSLRLPSHKECDIAKKADVEKFVKKGLDLVINCAVAKDQDRLELDPVKALETNILGTYWIVSLCKKRNVEYMHFGTTQEFEVTNVYSMTKKVGSEMPKLLDFKKSYVLKLGWLFGAQKGDFVSFILDSLRQGKKLGLTNNRWGSPLYVKDAVYFCWNLFLKKQYGEYNLSNAGRVTKWELAKKISEIVGLTHNFFINNKFKETALRPIDCSNPLGYLRPYEEALEEFIYEKYQNR